MKDAYLIPALSMLCACYLDRPLGDDGLARLTKIRLASYKLALENYRSDVGTYPDSHQGLKALCERPSNEQRWKGPYLQHEFLDDGWERPFIYLYPGNHGQKPDIISFGKDGQPGGTGPNEDIVSWQMNDGDKDR